jgi:hypothetical protein
MCCFCLKKDENGYTLLGKIIGCVALICVVTLVYCWDGC